MKKFLHSVQSTIGITGFAILLVVTGGVTVVALQTVSRSLELAQTSQAAKLKHEFFRLIIQGNSKKSSLEAAVKSVIYNEDFKTSIVRNSGIAGYNTNINNSKLAVTRKTKEFQQAQQELTQFLADHKNFILSLSPAVREQAIPIITLDIPSRIRVWQKEQREQDREWKCSGSTTDPICF